MYILFDIGATNIRIALSKDGITFEEPEKFTTPRNFEDGIRSFCDAARLFANGQKIIASAGGVKGPIDTAGTLLNPPDLPGWRGKNLKKHLEDNLQSPVFIENDTAIVGLGEAAAGAGKKKEIVAYVTVSTGTNGVRIINGKLDKSRHGFEIGHQIINMEKKIQCTCTTLPTLGHPEAYISGSGFEKRFSKKAYEITDPDVWEEAARILAVMLHNVIVSWSPDIIILGGPMITGDKGPTILINRVRFYVDDFLKIFPEAPPIEKAELGAFGGLHGALEFLNQELLKSDFNR